MYILKLYLPQGECTSCDGVDDGDEFATMVGAMRVLNFEEADMQNIWELIACVLHLGNLVFGG